MQVFPSGRLDKSVRVPVGLNRFLPHWTSRDLVRTMAWCDKERPSRITTSQNTTKYMWFQRGLPVHLKCRLSPFRPPISSSPSSIHLSCLRTVIDTEFSKSVHQMKNIGPRERSFSTPTVTTLGRDFEESGFLLGTPPALVHCTLRMARFPKCSSHWIAKFFVLTTP